MKRILMITFTTLLVSCQQSPNIAVSEPKKSDAFTASNLTVLDQNWHFTEQLDLNYALALESPPDTAISLIKKVEEDQSTGQFFVLEYDAKEGIFIFDSEGRYLNAFAKEGEGPGEALQIHDFCLNQGLILVGSTLKVMLFDSAGNLLVEKSKDDFAENITFGNIRSISTYKDGFLIRFESSPSGPANHDVCYIDAELNLVKSFHTPDLRTRIIPYGSSHVAVNDKGQIAILDIFGFRMELFNTDLELEKEYFGWHTPIDFEEAKEKVNLRKIETATAFLQDSNMPVDFYHWRGKFIAETANMQVKRSRYIVVDPQHEQFKSFPAYNAETETAIDRILSKARPINKQRMAAVVYDCQDWKTFKQAYPDLPVIGDQTAECPNMVFVDWKPGAFD